MTVIQIRPRRADAAPVRTGCGQAARTGENRGSQDAPRHLPDQWGAHPGLSARPTYSAHELALRSFWTERPLCAAYQAATGAASFSLRDLIRFAESLAADALAEVVAVEAYRDALPAHRHGWFGALGFEDQRRLALGGAQ